MNRYCTSDGMLLNARTWRQLVRMVFSIIVLASLNHADQAVGGEPKDDIPERIEAKALLLRGADAKLWGIFGMDGQEDPQAMLDLRSGNGGESGLTVALQHHEDTPNHVVLNLTSGKQYAELGVNDRWGSFLHFTDQEGNLRLGFSTRSQEAMGGAAAKWGNDAWPVFYTRAKNGDFRCLFIATPKGGRCEVYNAENDLVFQHGAGAPRGEFMNNGGMSRTEQREPSKVAGESASGGQQISHSPSSARSREDAQGRGTNAVASPQTVQPSASPQSDEGFVSLFDGRSLTGWEGGGGRFSVKDERTHFEFS